MIIGCRDKETEERHLRSNPLPEGWVRHYNDHTGRFFKDYSPEEWEEANRPNPASEALGLQCDEVYMADASWYKPQNLLALLEFTHGKEKTVIVGNSSHQNEIFERLIFEGNRFNVVRAKRGLLAERISAYDREVHANRASQGMGQPQ